VLVELAGGRQDRESDTRRARAPELRDVSREQRVRRGARLDGHDRAPEARRQREERARATDVGARVEEDRPPADGQHRRERLEKVKVAEAEDLHTARCERR
jgi:hypothetical protein